MNIVIKRTAVMLIGVTAGFCLHSEQKSDTSGFPWFRQLSFSTASVADIPLNTIHDESERFVLYRDTEQGDTSGYACNSFSDAAGLCSLTFRNSVRILFRDADFRMFWNLDKTAISKFGKTSLISKPGIRFSLPPSLPVTIGIQAGTLSAGGLYSRLTNPDISYGTSLFATDCSEPDGLSIRLSNSGSDDRPYGAAVCIGFPRAAVLFKTVSTNFLVQSDGTFAAATDITIRLPHTSTAGIHVCTGRFLLTGGSSSWFSDYPFFASGWYHYSVVGLFYKNSLLHSVLTVTGSESPFGGLNGTCRSDNSLHFGRFLLNISAFLTDGSTGINADSSRETTRAQICLNPQFRIPLHKDSSPYLKFGATAGAGIDNGTEPVSDRVTMKFGLGSIYNDTEKSFKSAVYATVSGNPEYRANIHASFKTIPVHPSAAFSYSIKPNETDGPVSKETVSTAISCKRDPTLTFNSSLAFKQQNNSFTGGTVSVSTVLIQKKHNICFNGKITVDISF
jgi:hypothetical protein